MISGLLESEPAHLSALQRSRLLANGLQSNVELALQNQLPVVFKHVSLCGYTHTRAHRHTHTATG